MMDAAEFVQQHRAKLQSLGLTSDEILFVLSIAGPAMTDLFGRANSFRLYKALLFHLLALSVASQTMNDEAAEGGRQS